MRCPDINRNNRLSCNSYHPPPSHFSSSNCNDPSPENKSAFRNAINSNEKSSKSCVRPCFVQLFRKQNVWRENETRRDFGKRRRGKGRRKVYERHRNGKFLRARIMQSRVLMKLKIQGVVLARDKFRTKFIFSIEAREKRNGREYWIQQA